MTVELLYTDKYRKQKRIEFKADADRINLSQHNIRAIDLSPLSSCLYLSELALEWNELEHIDLTPLSSCSRLQKLDLATNRLSSIDLTPLSSCTNLKHITLGTNELHSIDLSPLSSCRNLEWISLIRSHLEDIDFTPLQSCTKLRLLHLYENQLQSIDLTPLSSCSSLQVLRLDKNQLHSIDLGPLSSCIELKELNLDENLLERIDLTPLKSCPSIWLVGLRDNRFESDIDITQLYTLEKMAVFGPGKTSWLRPSVKNPVTHTIYLGPTSSYSWDFLHQVTDEFQKDLRVQYDIRRALGLSDYGFVDNDYTDFFLSIPPETSNEIARETIRTRLVKDIVKSVESHGSTTGLNLPELVSRHSEIAYIAHLIAELREREMEGTTASIRESMFGKLVVFRELWITAYGHSILQAANLMTHAALPFSLRFEHPLFTKIKDSFIALGFELQISESMQSGVEMSDELKRSIWWIAEQTGKGWPHRSKSDD